jgi:hypothetical protein
MIQGIASLGQGGRAGFEKLSVWSVHLGSSVVGGASMAMLVWIVITPFRTLLPDPIGIAVFVVIATAFTLTDLRLIRRGAWGPQVKASWFKRYGPRMSYALYGLILGAGLPTFAPYAATYVAFLAAGFMPSLIDALLLGSLFGLGRAFPVGPLAASRRIATKLPVALGVAYTRFPALSACLIFAAVGGALFAPS